MVSQGCTNVTALLAVLSTDEAVPATAKVMFEQMGQHVADLDVKINALEKQLLEQHKANPVSSFSRPFLGSGQLPLPPWP